MATNSGDTLNTNNGSLELDRLDSFFRQDEQAKAVKPVAQPRKPIDSTQIDAIANGEGLTPIQRQVMGALLAQESGGNANVGNSVDGAMGAGQIMPATFKMYAKAGEDIANPEHNLAVMARIVKDLGSKSGDDPAKIATGYFSGAGNINSGSTQAWKNDAADGNGKRVSSYVADVMNRIGGSQPAQQPKPLAVDGAPTWKSVTSKPEYMSMSAEEKAGMRDYYFEKYIAPDLQGDQVAQAKSWFDGEAAKLEPKEPGLIDRAMGVFDNIHTLAENREKERLQRLGVNVNAPIAPVNQEPSLLEKARQTAGNLIAGTLKIGPTAVKGAADIANMVTGDSIDLGVSKSMERGMKSIDEVIGSDKFNQQQKEFAALMADDNKGIGDLFGYLVDNPAILVDNTITTVGSMFLPAGAAKGAVGAATMLGAGKAAATKAAVIASMGTAASQNAADTFSTLEKENLQDRYKGAAVSGAVSLLMGIATGGGAEAAIAKRLAGDLQAGRIGLDAVKSFFKAAGKEGIQEAGEEVGNISGESVGSLTAPSTSSVGKRAALAGTLGAAIGGGVDVANNIGAPEQAPQPAPTAAPTAKPVAEAVPVAKAEPTAADQDTIDLAESRREILMAKRDGTTVDQISEDGTKMVAVDKAGKGLSKAEQAELQAIEQAGGDVAKLNELYGITKETPANVPEPAKVEQEAQAAQGQEGKTPEPVAEPATATVKESLTVDPAQVAAEPATVEQPQAAEEEATDNNEQVAIAAADYGEFAFSTGASRDSTEGLENQFEIDNYKKGWDRAADKAKQSKPKTEKEAIARREENKKQQESGGLSIGKLPNSAEPITVKDGVIHLGKYPAQDFDTGEDVRVANDATPQQIKDALTKAGAIGRGNKIFGLNNTETIKNEPQAVETKQAEAQGQEQQAAVAEPVKAEQAATGEPEATAGSAQPEPVAKPKTEKERNQQADYSEKWFGSQDKAQAFIDKKRIGDTHEVVKNGQKFEIKAKAAAPVEAEKPKTEKEAKAKKAATPRKMTNEGRAEDGKPINGGDTFATSSGRATTPYPTQKSEKYASQWLIDNAIAEATARGDDFNANMFKGEKANNLPSASVDSMQEYLFGQQPNVVPSILKPLESNAAPADDLDAMFDDVLAEEVAKAAPVKPKTEKEAKEKSSKKKADQNAAFLSDYFTPGNIVKSYSGFDRVVSYTPAAQNSSFSVTVKAVKKDGENWVDTGEDARTHATFPSQKEPVARVSVEVKPSTEKEARTTGQAAVSAAKNTAQGFGNAIDGLGKLFGGKGTFGSGPVFNEETYAKAKPLFQAAVANFDQAGADIKEVMRAVVKSVLDKFGEAVVNNMKPYIVRFVGEYQQPANLVDHLYNVITAGNMPKDNPALRKMVAEFDKKEVSQERLKQAQEDIEAAIARVARDAVAKGGTDAEIFARLQDLYQSQPNLNIRTSTSVENQAYSTPAPLAFLAARLAGIGKDTKTYEPTAGNGMLLITANPANATANELEGQRFANLKAQGFKALQGDALEADVKAKSQDAVITNPPFGSVKDANGNATKVPVDGYKIGKIDHLIAAKALDAMKDDGKAALIIGADKVTGGLSADDRTFFNWLYSNYNVVGQFEVDGKLYTRQGAGWPVRVIAINGRNKSGNVSPREGTIGRAKSWSEVYESYQNVLDASNTNVGNTQGSVDGGSQTSANNELQSISQPAGTKASGTNSGRSGGSTGSTRNERGTGTGTGSNSGKQPSESVGSPTGTDGQLAEDNKTDQLGEGKPTSGAPANAGATKPARDTGADRVDGNEFQAPYIPRSARKDEGVLIPINMRDSTQDALSRLEDEVGDIDQFAAKELGYKSVDKLHDALMGLQVDSVATAISQIKNGKGVVIADQTGIGKGRQAAAIIRWAVKNGHIPVFVTVKPQLFTDMYGDLADIGTSNVNPLILNVDESISGKNGEKLFANNKANHKRVIEGIASSGQLPANTNALFMTYSQINTDNVQRRAVMALSDKAVFILDESHNAAGQSGTGKFIIDALQAAKGVTYLSATFAKRPDNVPLYFKTDIGEAIGDDQALMSAMLAGGLPLQTVVSNNLVKSGQMFRRERSYDGVSITTNIDTANRASHEKLSDTVTAALRAIVDADRTFHEIFFDAMKEQIEKNGGTALDIAGNQASQSVAHTEFSSVVHNFVRQLLLGLKADTAAKQAIAAIKEGKRPIIAVENTMGSFLQEYAANNNIQQDGPLGSFDYRTVLSRALERSRHVVKVDEKGNKVKSYVPLKDLDPITRSAYDKAQRVIDGLNMDIPVSPIDWMRAQLAKAGYTVAEITGRDLAVDYSNPKKPILSRLSNEEQNDKVATTRKFNAGELDALILNVAGSTGISLHASEKFKDQRPRHMIIAQAAQDINIFMQMLGRIHRTGQVVLPSYEILNADLPAEKRPTALLSKKMKSLNANTSSNTESATSVKAADMMNKYGDQVVGQYLDDNPDIRKDLGFTGAQIGEKGDADEDIARKATGRLALMPVEVQKHVYADLEEQYSTLIEYLNKTNQNDLEPRTFDFDAKEVKQDIIFKGDNPNSPFGADAVYNEFSIKAQGSPMTPAEIKASMNEHLDGKTAIEHSDAIILKMRADNKEYFAKQIEKLKAEGETEINMSEFDDAFDPKAREPIAFINSHRIGTTFRVEINGDLYNAVVTNIRNVHKGNGSPYAMSKVHVTVAVNGALRSVTVPATQFKRIEVTALGANNADRLFDAVPRNEREKAKIITGNLLSAYGELKGTTGTIINFTREDGSVEQGILLPKKFDFKTNTMGDFNLRSGEEAFKFLSESNSRDVDKIGISSRDGTVRITPKGDGVTIQVPKSKAKGAKYFLEKTILDVTGDFTSSGNFMTATVPSSKAAKAIDAVMKKSALYVAPSMSDEAKTILGVVDKAAGGTELLDITQDSALAGNQSSVAQMKALASRLADGKITPSEYKLALTQLTTRIAATTLNSTGTANIRAALLAAKESKFMRADTIDFALWMLDKNPAIAAELSMSFKDSKKGSPAGSYKSAERLITLFKQEVNSGTAVHEMLHHTERMMPSYIQREIVREWQRAWNAEWDKSSPEVRKAMSTMLESAAGNDQAFKDMAKAFQNGTLNYDTHYQLANPSEYWAVNATRLMSDKYAANHSWAKKAKQFIKDLIAYVKDAFGFTEKDPIVKALNAVLNGDGKMISSRVLAELTGEVMNGLSLNDLGQSATTERTQQDLIKEFGKPTFSSIDWWDKSVGTQFNKAAKNPEFKKVFDLFLARENATSLTAVRAAELAPGFLPRVDDFKSAAITLLKGKKASRQHELAAQAILEGTLYGQSVLDGKVWSVDELKAKGLDQQGIALYTQARDAIDASLNEVAAAEGYAALQMFIPRAMRAAVMDNPRDAVEMLRKAIDKRIAMDEKRLQAMKNKGATDEALAELEQDIEDAKDALNTMEQIFAHVDLLKAAGYAPLMRFGKYFVSVEEVDPSTGKTVVNESGEPNTVFFSRYETEGEAQEAYFRMKVAHGNDKTMKVISGPVNDEKYKMYAGISPETMALFAEVVGAKEVENKFYQQAISERSALKRRLERKAIAGYSQDLPRVLANFITSNGRHSAGRYYTRDINSAIKYIPREKGDVQKEAQRLKEYLDNPQDAGAMSSGLAFTWFLGGNIASALINATQPVMMSLPYLSQWGTGKASAALTKAAPMAMGKKQITDPQLRHDLKRASQEGKVDAQEIFHLYTVGIQGVANALSGKMSKLPLVGKHVKGATESGRARMNAALTLWGMPFAVVEGFNRRLTFIAAWNMAKAQGEADPYAFATRAVDETQGIYNKVNRPNWARSALGRTVFTFTQFRVMNVELIKRMATKGGPAGKRAAAVYLAVLILAAGLGGLPYADDIDDIIDTVGQFFLGYDTNMKRNKREWAHGTLGKFYGDLALYGMSSQLPLDFGGRMGLGNMIPATGIGKPSNKDRTASELMELGGPVLGGLLKQAGDAYEEAAIGNGGKALAGMAPTSIKNMAAGLDMMATGKAKDMRGREKIDVTPAEGVIKAVGFNPTKVSNVNRTNMPIQQDLALQKMIESNIVDKWAQGIAQKDKAMQDEAKEMMSEWNRKNPKTPVAITANQIRSKVKTLNTPADTRLFKSAPREMRGRVSAGLDDGN